MVASYVPLVPAVHLEPEVVLMGLLPPLLYATAIQTSLVDFSRNVRSILLLSVGLVVVTTVVVGSLVVLVLRASAGPQRSAGLNRLDELEYDDPHGGRQDPRSPQPASANWRR